MSRIMEEGPLLTTRVRLRLEGKAHGDQGGTLFPREGDRPWDQSIRPRHWPLTPRTFISDQLLRPRPGNHVGTGIQPQTGPSCSQKAVSSGLQST